ncbi:hypothetical protein [Flavobacterium marginilacus]|uniref:hypothetical protein n=1 Tax=Flavobacterium marginilacus TaxID=3003256 RepID=UPI00248D57EA|nr:hypothetical protein [Flavobacterium marginilacus]
MKNRIQQIIKQLAKTPKKIFLIDASGAFLTAFLLFAVLKTWHEYIGIPIKTITVLSIIALVFSIYSALCFAFFNTKKWKRYLKIIAVSNLLYCCLTFGLLIYNFTRLSVIGIIYFGGEIVIICMLIYLELTTLKSTAQNA